MDIYFSNQNELYNRLLPALRIKKKEIKKEIKNITEIDIWNYLKNNIWNQTTGLSLSIMVDDILNIDIKNLIDYTINSKQDVI